MKTVVAALHPSTGEKPKAPAAPANAQWLAMKRVREPRAANRHMRFDLMTSIWSGATVGCIGAAVIPPFSESGD
jgi:hypothetical protein